MKIPEVFSAVTTPMYSTACSTDLVVASLLASAFGPPVGFMPGTLSVSRGLSPANCISQPSCGAPVTSRHAGITSAAEQRLMTVARRLYGPFSIVTDSERQLLTSYLHGHDHLDIDNNVADIIPTVDFQSFHIINSWLVSIAEVFPAPMDMDRLYQARSKVILHYSILRTIFVGTDDRMLQVILNRADPVFYRVECDNPERSQERIEPTTN